MTDVLTSKQRSYCMSRIRGKNTKPELALRKSLWGIGYRYRVNYKLTGKPDIVCPGKKVAVFVHGCFWHFCPEHCTVPDTNRDFWGEKLGRNAERDKEVTAKLEKEGWEVIRIWEHEIIADLASCVSRIVRVLRE